MSSGGISGPEPALTNTPRPGDTPEQAAARYRPRDPLLQERQKTHGDFGSNARISQQIKMIYHGADYYKYKPEHKEALDMIALKIGRILSGQSNFKDHWDDIAGYAKLGAEACE